MDLLVSYRPLARVFNSARLAFLSNYGPVLSQLPSHLSFFCSSIIRLQKQ